MTRRYRYAAHGWLLCLLLAVFYAGPAGAAEADTRDAEPPASEAVGESAEADPEQTGTDPEASPPGAGGTTGDTAADGPAGNGDKPGEAPGVFVPTEDISEDFAVSFPVDI